MRGRLVSPGRDRPPLRHATKPTPAMREAMANAEVGDEQEREDPTVLELERRTAELLGQEEAVYLPTATMGNQIALAILGERGGELIVEERAHIMVSELGGAAYHSGLQTRGLPGYRGRISAEQVRATVMGRRRVLDAARCRCSRSRTRTTRAGGTVWPLGELRETVAAARELGLRTHLDGARLMNAAVASGIPAAEIASGFDTATICLSKGLGCPLGALITGSTRADAPGADREAPLRRRDAAGRHRRGRRHLRTRSQRRPARGRPRAGTTARRGVGRGRPVRSISSSCRRTSCSSTSHPSG